jgi:hypothetical protein
MKAKVWRTVEEWLALALLLIISLLIFIIGYAAALVVLDAVPEASAEEFVRYPIAYVDVNADSYLNVRKTPGGECTSYQLRAYQDVVILATDGDWALVILEKYMPLRHIKNPLGWVHRDYIRPYREYIIPITKEPAAATADPDVH